MERGGRSVWATRWERETEEGWWMSLTEIASSYDFLLSIEFAVVRHSSRTNKSRRRESRKRIRRDVSTQVGKLSDRTDGSQQQSEEGLRSVCLRLGVEDKRFNFKRTDKYIKTWQSKRASISIKNLVSQLALSFTPSVHTYLNYFDENLSRHCDSFIAHSSHIWVAFLSIFRPLLPLKLTTKKNIVPLIYFIYIHQQTRDWSKVSEWEWTCAKDK